MSDLDEKIINEPKRLIPDRVFLISDHFGGALETVLKNDFNFPSLLLSIKPREPISSVYNIALYPRDSRSEIRGAYLFRLRSCAACILVSKQMVSSAIIHVFSFLSIRTISGRWLVIKISVGRVDTPLLRPGKSTLISYEQSHFCSISYRCFKIELCLHVYLGNVIEQNFRT